MKKSLLALFVLSLGLLSPEVSAATKNLKISKNINSIEASAGVNVIYRPTNGPASVTISGDTKRIDLIELKTSGKTLEISPKTTGFGRKNGKRLKGITITVHAPIVSSIEASSSASVRCVSGISAVNKKIELEASSGASISFSSILCKSFDAETSSGGSVTVKSLQANSSEFEATSGSSINIASIKTSKIECDASSGSSITLRGCADYGSFEAESGGSIHGQHLSVKDAKIDKSISGSVKLSRR